MKTKEQLIDELVEMRHRIAELEASETERKRVEEALRETSARLSRLIEAIPDAVYFKDAQGRTLVVNKAHEELLGLPREKIIGKTDEQLLPPDLAEQCRRSDEEAMKRREPIRVEEQMTDDSGKKIFFDTIKSPLLDDQGNVRGLVGISRDITGRKRVEEALRRAHDELEIRVQERTAELARANKALQAEITERKQAEEALQASYRHQAGILGSMLDAVIVANPDGTIRTLNRAALELLGYAEQELIGQPVGTIFEEEEEEEEEEAFFRGSGLARLVREGVARDVELTLLAKSGERIPVVFNGSVIRDDEGHLRAVLGVARDMRERKEAEEALRESEARYRTLFNSISDSILLINLNDFTIIDANPAALKQVKMEEGEVVGKTCYEVTHLRCSPCKPPDHVCPIQEMMETAGRSITLEHTHYDRDGNPFYMEISASPVKDAEGRILHVVHIARDITERKRAEREIEERRMYLEGVLGAAPDAIVTLDARHRIVEWNTGAERLFGYSRQEAIGQNLDHLITNPDTFEEAVGLTQTVMSEREVPPTETVRYRKDGPHVHVIVAGSPILVGDELIGVVAVYTDITARKRMEEALRALALLDELTGLYNRRGFFTLAEQQLKTADRAKMKMLLLFADFDDLKRINDTFGHPEGDLALIEVADVLRETFRESDIIARMAGDEFVVLALETTEDSAEIITTRLQENLEARNARGDCRYKLSLSVGIARYDPKHPCFIDELLAQADRLMYEHKQGNQMS